MQFFRNPSADFLDLPSISSHKPRNFTFPEFANQRGTVLKKPEKRVFPGMLIFLIPGSSQEHEMDFKKNFKLLNENPEKQTSTDRNRKVDFPGPVRFAVNSLHFKGNFCIHYSYLENCTFQDLSLIHLEISHSRNLPNQRELSCRILENRHSRKASVGIIGRKALSSKNNIFLVKLLKIHYCLD